MEAQKPVQVSPFIKGARWTFLLLGVVYGSTRFATLNRKEQQRKAEWERTRPEREAREKAEKLKRTRDEMEQLSKDTGVEFPLS